MDETPGNSRLKVVLINPPIETHSRLWFSLSIACVAAFLLQEGFEVEVLDLIGEQLSRDEFRKRIQSTNAEYFGIGGIITAFNNVVDIAQYIRESHPDSVIFAGNTVAYTIPEIILKNSQIDIVVLGEGEVTASELLHTLQDGRKLEQVSGIAYKDQSKKIIKTAKRTPIKDLDRLPFPAWHLLPIENYFRNVHARYGLISTVRGCPYNCTFCCHTFMGYAARYRSAESVLAELLEFHKRYRIESFQFFDDLSMINKKNLTRFCELKARSELSPMPWTISGRINLMDEELGAALEQANCRDIGFGIESYDQDVLDSLNKRVTLAQVDKALALCDKHHIGYHGSSFMIGALNETSQSVRKTSQFCRKHRLNYEPHFITPFPGTELYDYAIKTGLITDELEYLRKLSLQGNTDYLLVNLTRNLTDKQLQDLRSENLYFPRPKAPIPSDLVSRAGKRIVDDGPINFAKRFSRFVYQRYFKKDYYHGSFERYGNIWE